MSDTTQVSVCRYDGKGLIEAKKKERGKEGKSMEIKRPRKEERISGKV